MSRAQSAIEFTILFAVVAMLFLLLFAYVNREFGVVTQSTETQQNVARLEQLRDAIYTLDRMPPGFSGNYTLELKDDASQSELSFIRDGVTGRVRELVLSQQNGNNQVVSIPASITLVVDECADPQQVNYEFIRTVDGIGICCGSCENDALPGQNEIYLQCLRDYPNNRTGFYRDCEQEITALDDELEGIRVRCDATGFVDIKLKRVFPDQPWEEYMVANGSSPYNEGAIHTAEVDDLVWHIPNGLPGQIASDDEMGGDLSGLELRLTARCFKQTGTIEFTSFPWYYVQNWTVGEYQPVDTTYIWTPYHIVSNLGFSDHGSDALCQKLNGSHGPYLFTGSQEGACALGYSSITAWPFPPNDDYSAVQIELEVHESAGTDDLRLYFADFPYSFSGSNLLTLPGGFSIEVWDADGIPISGSTNITFPADKQDVDKFAAFVVERGAVGNYVVNFSLNTLWYQTLNTT